MRDVFPDDRHNIRDCLPVDMEATRRAAALNESENHVLVGPSAMHFRHTLNPTDVGFVGLDNFSSAAHRLNADDPHCLTDAMRHEPCGFESDA
jgi:hypothetical protein